MNKLIPLLSIVIPIYNAEEYLTRCLDSVFAQTEMDIEVILVNDGSTDNSGTLCDEFAQKDSRIKVIHQENQGVSAARNNALAQATGDFIGFVDSDDYVHSNMFKKMLKTAEETNADIVMCDALTVYDNGKTELDTIMQLSENRILEKFDFTPSLLLEMAGSAWRCIYKNNRCNDKLCKQTLAFPLGVKFSEDRIFNIYALGYAKKIAYLKEPLYYRYVNLKSAVHRFHGDYFEAYKKAKFETEKAIKSAWNDDEKYQKAYLSQFITGSLMAINNYYYKTSPLSSKERRQAVIDLCNDKTLREAIKTKGVTSNHEKWILGKNYNLLILYAKLANFKHRR